MTEKKALKGVCLLFFEQGYEGPPWAFQDSRFIEPPTADWPHERWSHDGLHLLKDGDELTIYSDERDDDIVWSGTLLFVDGEPVGVDREALLYWFRKEYPAALIPAQDGGDHE